MYRVEISETQGRADNPRIAELHAIMAGIDIVPKESYYDRLALAVRLGGMAYHGRIIHKGNDAMPMYLLAMFKAQVNELKQLLKDG